MTHSIDGLRNKLSGVRALVNQGAFLSFSAEEKASLLADAQKLTRKLDAIGESVLTVGLLGGTGVGKSCIMNALAGKEISSTSHRRPHTDMIIVYHHSNVELSSSLGLAGVSWREIVHDADAIRQIVLCDLPDFDSLLGEHCERVLGFLHHLDLLIWVTSPEKYADASFYAFLQQTPKAKENFCFVLNKVDLFFNNGLETGYDQLGRVTARFQEHLVGNGILHPLIYSLSAIEVVDSRRATPWNQFAGFRHHVFQRRDSKELMGIKSANLDVEIQQLVSVFEKEVSRQESLHLLIGEIIRELESQRAEWIRIGREAFDHWLRTHLSKRLFQLAADASPLVGPSHVVGELAQAWRKWGKGDDERDLVPVSEDDGAGMLLRRQLERIENRAVHQLLVLGFSAAYADQLNHVLDTQKGWEDLGRRLREYVQIRLTDRHTGSFRRFKMVQYLVYSLLLLFLLMALGGEAAWLDLLEDPSWLHLGRLFTTMVNHVYSPAGVAALGSYVVLLGIAGLRFFGRFRKILQGRKQKIIETLKLELEGIWLEQLEGTLHRLREYERQIGSRISAFATLNETLEKD